MSNLLVSLKEFILKNYFSFLVILVVFLAMILRYWHTKVGLPYLYNWDEPQTASTALKIMKTGDYNPHFFNYGSMMIYSNFVVDILHYLSLMGHPSTAESYLTNMNEIKINADTGWHWTISHPSFYHWNRVLTALLGTGTVLVTYLIGKHVFNKWIGIVAALFLAVLPFHIGQSAWITTDAPVAFFVLTVVLFSLLFIKDKKFSYFLLSLVFVGISISTKYNAALSMLIPLFALFIVFIQSRETVKTYMWFLIPVVPIVIFFMIMPYAIIDLTSFLNNVGYEVRHYKILGHGSATSIPGWEHFNFQMHQFYRQLGLANTILIGIGFIGIFIRPILVFVLVLPIIYILYMSGMTVNFHRNFVQVYPFIAILFASGIYVIYYLFDLIQKRIFPNKQWISNILTIVIVLGFLLPQLLTSIETAKAKYKSRDTRTIVIDKINALKNINSVVIAKELKVHQQDLKRLKIPYSVKPLLTMFLGAISKNTIFLMPKNIARDKKKQALLQKLIASIDRSSIVTTVGGGGTRIDIFSVNPGLLIVKDLPIISTKINVNKPFLVDLSSCNLSKTYKGNPLGMYWSGYVQTPVYILKADGYNLIINAKGSKAFDEFAKLKIQVFSVINKKSIQLAEKIIETTSNYADYALPLNITEDTNISIKVAFINDKGRKEPKEDRNAYLKSIMLKKQ
jgi:hypothetical protein